MAEKAEGAYSPSDDDLNELVDDVMGRDDSPGATDDETPANPDASSAEEETTEETEASDETPAGEAAEDEQEEGDPNAEPDPDAPPAKPAAVAGEKPFQFKASGAEHAFQGAVELPDGSAKLTPEATKNLKNVFASYVENQRRHKEETRELKRQLRDTTTRRSAKEIEADTVLELFDKLESMTPQERWLWAEEFGTKAPALKLKAKEAALDARQKEIERGGPEPLEEETQERFHDTVKGEVATTFQRLFATPAAQHLTEEDRKALVQKWLQRGTKLVVTLDKDDPETGGKKGQQVFDDTDIVDDFNDRVKVRQEAAKTLSISKKNDKLNADRKTPNRIPPTVRGGKTPAAGGDGKGKVPKGKKGFREAFLGGKLDAKDE